MAIITFKYRNKDTENPIEGLEIQYSVQTVAVLAKTKGSIDETKSQRGAVSFTEPLLTGSETTDGDGIIEVNVVSMFTDEMFLQMYQKFGNLKEYNVSVLITLTCIKQQIGPYLYLGTTEVPQELLSYNVTKKGPTYAYPNLNYSDEVTDFYVPEVVINKELLVEYQAIKLRSQQNYLEKLKSFQGEIESQSILQIPTLTRYNPINITQIITRCLELNVGCLENSVTFTKDAGLTPGPSTRLEGMRNKIEQISSLYPNVTIDQGEGLPYQNIGVIPIPFRGYSFYQKDGSVGNNDIEFSAYLMSNYAPSDLVVEESDMRNTTEPSLSLNGEIIEISRWGEVDKQLETYYETRGLSYYFVFSDINQIVMKWQQDNKLPEVGLVSGDVLSVTSFIKSNQPIEACNFFEDCKIPTNPGLQGGQYTSSLVIK